MNTTTDTKPLMTLDEMEKIRVAYIKVYGKRWREVFAKYYWCVYEGNECKTVEVKCERCPHV